MAVDGRHERQAPDGRSKGRFKELAHRTRDTCEKASLPGGGGEHAPYQPVNTAAALSLGKASHCSAAGAQGPGVFRIAKDLVTACNGVHHLALHPAFFERSTLRI